MQTSEHEDSSSLGHIPGERWQFDESVTAVFSDMLSRSIPQYEVMRKCVFDMGMAMLIPGTRIVDLGCSRGDGIAAFVDALAHRNRYLGIEVSKPMLEAARKRFSREIEAELVKIEAFDLRDGYPAGKAGLTLSILSLQFTPIEHRQRILRDVYRSTVQGGAFILVEKVLGATAGINERMVDIYYGHKKNRGYTNEEVERKRLALEGVLVPVTARWNEELLRDAGFREVDCFWRWMNFAGWIGRK
jgi:tRNA (cmo5U34)-methyltransferase